MIKGNFMLGLIANATSIGGFPFTAGKGAAIDDGFFEVFLLRSPGNILELQELIGTLLAGQANSKLVIQRSAKSLEFSCEKPCDWTLDGEYGGQHSHLTIENKHRALNILLPPA